MKSIRKFTDWLIDTDAVIILLLGMTLVMVSACLVVAVCTKNETATQFVEAVKYGELDSGDTMFQTNDGNLYAFHARFVEQNGSRFLLRLRINDPKDPKDDELLELWSTPSVSYDIDWAE